MPTKDDERALVACAFWLHVGLVFATIAAGGVLLLLSGDTSVVTALVLVVVGIVLGAASWRRGREIVERTERPSTRRPSSIDEMRRARDGYTAP
jgi:hypothetical protein